MSIPVKNADRETTAKSRFVDIFREKADLLSLFTSFTDETQAIENALFELFDGFNVNTAVGTQLDAIGATVGRDREGADDDIYRLRIRARILINLSSGTVPQIIRLVNLLLPDGVTASYNPYYPASFVFETEGAIGGDERAAEVGSAMLEVAPAGVHASLIYSVEGPGTDFRFSDSDEPETSSEGFIGVNQAGTAWIDHTVTGFGAGDDIFGLAYGGGSVVAVGENGKLAHSTDSGVTWAGATDPASGGSNWRWVVYLGGTFVAGGSGGHLITSTDGGATWSLSATLSAGQTHYGAAGNGRFVTCGTGGDIYSSPNGVTWTLQHSIGAVNANAIEYLNGLFVCAGASNKLATSVDGDSWTDQTLNLGGGTALCLSYGASLYIVAGTSGKLASSPDGATWTLQTTGLTGEIRSIGTDGTTVVIGGVDASSKNLAYSTDAVSWTSLHAGPGGADLTGVQYFGGVFEVAGSGFLYSSTDAAVWTARVTTGSGFGFQSAFAHSSGLSDDADGTMFAFGSNRRFMTSANTATNGGQWPGLVTNA